MRDLDAECFKLQRRFPALKLTIITDSARHQEYYVVRNIQEEKHHCCIQTDNL